MIAENKLESVYNVWDIVDYRGSKMIVDSVSYSTSECNSGFHYELRSPSIFTDESNLLYANTTNDNN